jgi:hypothetical protein
MIQNEKQKFKTCSAAEVFNFGKSSSLRFPPHFAKLKANIDYGPIHGGGAVFALYQLGIAIVIQLT